MNASNQMTEKQGWKIHFSLGNLYPTDITLQETQVIRDLNSELKLTRIEASDIIDWLQMVESSKIGSPTFEAAVDKLRSFIQYKQQIA